MLKHGVRKIPRGKGGKHRVRKIPIQAQLALGTLRYGNESAVFKEFSGRVVIL